MFRGRTQIPAGRWVVCVLLAVVACPLAVFAQHSSPAAGTVVNAIPLVNVGGGPMESQFESLDFSQIMLDHQKIGPSPKELERQQKLVNSGTISALDLAAPTKAVDEFNQATALLRGQHSSEAIGHLQKAVAVYPKFVSAHNYLGMAYVDLDDTAHAQSEFEIATNLDAKFASPFMNLGRLALAQNNYTGAEAQLQKAVALRPSDPAVLTALAYAQNGNRDYRDAIQTANKVHSLQHDGMGNVHYVAAVAAVSLSDYTVAQSEFAMFLHEDPSNPLAATARSNLDILDRAQQAAADAKRQPTLAAVQPPPNLANSDRLKAQLAGAGTEGGGDTAEVAMATEIGSPLESSADIGRGASSPNQWTIRKVVDEVAVFFGVTSGGHTITDLESSDIKVRDDNKPPEKVLQFAPQSKLPLRLGVLIDTSGSVQPRFSFEKNAAAKFMEEMLSNSADLGFVAGFADKPNVTQDFTGDHAKLAHGVEQLSNNGGTALFDAVSYACWKLAAYPERERVAKVLVVVSDGEENASHSTLRQVIRDEEATGVTVYTISTKEGRAITTDADKVLQTLSERSGGEALFPGDMSALGKSFDKLRDQIRSRYLIAYKPADFEPNGKYRTISIVAEKNGKHLQVHARKGYHARAEAATP